MPELDCVEISTALFPLRSQCEGQEAALECGVGAERSAPARQGCCGASCKSISIDSLPRLGALESQVSLLQV